ncbi:MAG: hypothetical protein ABL927_10415, partial [Bdellovibrionales bacterium]
TGCIPKYLDEIRYSASSDEEIERLCFTQEGILLNEFDKIFNDIFQKRSNTFKKIVKTLLIKKISAEEIAKQLGQTLNSEISSDLKNLVLSGFIARDFTYAPNGQRTKKSVYRVKDNYLRFYLKYIEPRSEKIKQANEFSGWPKLSKSLDSILGLQFENLILNHLPETLKGLGIPLNNVQSASPYFQTPTTKNKGACQVDLLVQCDNDIWYLCEFKLRKKIEATVVSDMKFKLNTIAKPKHISLRSALVYFGSITPDIVNEFDRTLNFEKLLLASE